MRVQKVCTTEFVYQKSIDSRGAQGLDRKKRPRNIRALSNHLSSDFSNALVIVTIS